MMMMEDKLGQIAAEVRGCQLCALAQGRKNAVPGEGPAHATIMLIGEGPGFHENEQGRPFVGAAGKFLEQLLAASDLKRTDVFIANVVKCRPPENRDPLPEELAACNGYLDRQIQAIDPLVIVTLGRYSMGKFFENARISEVHGKPKWLGSRFIIPMFHPAAALHQPKYRPMLVEDFSHLRKWVAEAEARNKPQPPPKAEESATQMKLF